MTVEEFNALYSAMGCLKEGIELLDADPCKNEFRSGWLMEARRERESAMKILRKISRYDLE